MNQTSSIKNGNAGNGRPPDSPDSKTIAEAARILTDGGLVAFPTETVYGLGADATNDKAVARIFEAKGRPRFNPLIVHVPDAETAARDTAFDDRARKLARHFWPGPLTLVLPRTANCRISLLCSAGLDSLAVRAPGHQVAQTLLKAFGRPLAAPSANASGQVSPTTAQHVVDSLGDRVNLILDGGPCSLGIESTVLDLTGQEPVLLRPGSITIDNLVAVVGPIASAKDNSRIASPGMLVSHYAPNLPLRLNARDAGTDEALLAFGPQPIQGAGSYLNLSEKGDLQEAAANLFAMLRKLDRTNLSRIAVMTIPDHGLGAAINDRLQRAAAPRPV